MAGPRISNIPLELQFEEYSQFEIDVQHVVVDFIISHELGHMLQNVGYKSRVASNTDLTNEIDADKNGFICFYASSHGYRSKVFHGLDIDEATRVILGPVSFFAFSNLRWSLLHGLLSKKVEVLQDANAGNRLIREQAHFETERIRARNMFNTIDMYLRYLLQKGLVKSVPSLDLVGVFLANVAEFADMIRETINSMSDADLRQAVPISETLSPQE